MHSFSFGELVLIFGIILILFGGSRLASIGKSLGEGISNFKKGLNAPAVTEDEKVTSNVQNSTQHSQQPHQAKVTGENPVLLESSHTQSMAAAGATSAHVHSHACSHGHAHSHGHVHGGHGQTQTENKMV